MCCCVDVVLERERDFFFFTEDYRPAKPNIKYNKDIFDNDFKENIENMKTISIQYNKHILVYMNNRNKCICEDGKDVDLYPSILQHKRIKFKFANDANEIFANKTGDREFYATITEEVEGEEKTILFFTKNDLNNPNNAEIFKDSKYILISDNSGGTIKISHNKDGGKTYIQMSRFTFQQIQDICKNGKSFFRCCCNKNVDINEIGNLRY